MIDLCGVKSKMGVMLTKDEARRKIAKLAQKYASQAEVYGQADYNEARARMDFINPLFKLLGWDMDNEKGLLQYLREVILEDRVSVDGRVKYPDYSFRLGNTVLFYVEAKKPSVNIKDDKESALQLRHYGWNTGLTMSLLTNFREFAVYDCRVKPNRKDKAHVARLTYFTYQDLTEKQGVFGDQRDGFDFLWDTFTQENVSKGSFEKFIKDDGDRFKRGVLTVDQDFLLFLEDWRKKFAASILRDNKDLTEWELNVAVQQVLDRVVFLRFAEDRGIESLGSLEKAVKTHEAGKCYRNLYELFELADDKYNAGLFDMGKDGISRKLTVENKLLQEFVRGLYYPGPYNFQAIPVEILGSAYERFLGKTIRITPGKMVKVAEKPEVRKAGGVFYTPQYIVDYIVEHTVGKLLEGKTPKEAAKIKIVDPACGSGSFLLGAYQYVLDWHRNYYALHLPPSKGKKTEPLTPDGQLTIEEKKRILSNNIFGVDLDVIAVEFAKLSLLLKCMEGEHANVFQRLKLYGERLLPNIDGNICCGNSLVDVDFYDDDLDDTVIRPLSWKKTFPQVFREGGFDVVIGNPPYVSIRTTDFNSAIKPYFKSHYKLAVGQYDLYALFVERAEKILAENGKCGFIMPKRMATNETFQQLRQFYRSQLLLESYVDSGMPFAGASVETNMLIATKRTELDSQEINVYKLDREGIPQFWHSVSADIIGDMPFEIFPFLIPPQCLSIIQKIQSLNTVPLGNLCTIIRGFECGFNDPRIGKRKTAYPIIRGEHVRRYRIEPTNYYVRPDFKKEPRIFKTKDIFLTVPKLITKFVSNNLQFALDTVGYCNTNVLYNVHVHKDTDIHFLLGLLNSRLVNFWFKYMYGNDDKLFPHIQKNQLESIPILPIGSTKEKNELCDAITSQAKNLLRFYREKSEMFMSSRVHQIERKIDYCEDKIDDAVYRLYGLTDEEIALIENQ